MPSHENTCWPHSTMKLQSCCLLHSRILISIIYWHFHQRNLCKCIVCMEDNNSLESQFAPYSSALPGVEAAVICLFAASWGCQIILILTLNVFQRWFVSFLILRGLAIKWQDCYYEDTTMTSLLSLLLQLIYSISSHYLIATYHRLCIPTPRDEATKLPCLQACPLQ